MPELTEGLLDFPCELDIKAVGRDVPGFAELVLSLVREHAPEVGMQSLRTRQSSGGKYLSVTITLLASSRGQMDGIYAALSAHPAILTAL